MITKSEIIADAKRTGLSPQVIEKDYVLGWALAGIFNHPALKNQWVFKGGTCLKKGYFETYRFSEDLDFTIMDPKHIDATFLTNVFKEISAWVYQQSGIQFPEHKIEFEVYPNKAGKTSCQGKLCYLGPLAPTSPKQWPKIKLDLTADEVLADKPNIISINHPYSDLPKEGIHILSYSYPEVFAEKTRALSERTRPRDLYDVINLFRLPHPTKEHSLVSKLLAQKCAFKNAKIPVFHDLEKHYQACKAGWQDQLSHQILVLAPFDSYWNELPQFFDWLESGKKETLAHISKINTPIAFDEATEKMLAQYSTMDTIRFAAASRLCLQIRYQKEDGTIQNYLAEPYSLRVTQEKVLLFYALKRYERQIRAFRMDRILTATVSTEPFRPVYEVEIFPKGTVSIKPLAQNHYRRF